MIEGIWNGLKAVFNWSPVVFVREQFSKLVSYFREDLLPGLKAPFEEFIGFVTGIFNKIAEGIANIRNLFSRGEDGKLRFSMEVDEPDPLKVALPEPITPKRVEGSLQRDETLTGSPVGTKAADVTGPVKTEVPEYHQTQAVKTNAVSGLMKPTVGFQEALEKAEKAAKADNRLAVKILGKTEKREMRALGEKLDKREGYFGGRSPTRARAVAQDQRLFGADRKTIAGRAHTSEMRQAPDLSRVKLFDKLESEFPRIFERFFDEQDTSKRFSAFRWWRDYIACCS